MLSMQNWEAMQPAVNYEQHNSWYSSMFAANIKTEPGTTSPPLQSMTPPTSTSSSSAAMAMTPTSQLEQYLKQHHHHQQQQQHMAPMDTMSTMTPSPSNNDSMQHHFFDGSTTSSMQQQLYQQQFQQAQQAAAHNAVGATHLPLGFNPLTPPGLPSAVLPSISHFYSHGSLRPGCQQTLSPQSHLVSTTPLMDGGGDKLQPSQALTPRNTPPMDVTPPKSPKPMIGNATTATGSVLQQQSSDSSLAMEKDQDLVSNSSEDMHRYMVESEDDESIRMPIYNSHGKMKNYKCRTCGLVAITKIAFWEHARSHMKPEKILQCPKCPFVTELKHHLEYHIRKHKNLKPFQCEKCSYTCVNKSMLNSHRKSHSSVYQYRCSDCDYATKYCHSFKLHLRKYDHKPGMVLDEEGIPNPSVVIDVYGTRRGPKNKGSAAGGSSKRCKQSGDMKIHALSSSQLSAALQGFHVPQHQMPASPAKSSSSVTSDLPSITLNMAIQQQHQQHQAQQLLQQKQQQQHQQQQQQEQQQQQQKQQQQQQEQKYQTAAAQTAQQTMSNLLPPLASILQQNHNMAFFPYWNLNMQMLAAQQQAAVLAQLSPRMRETALQHLQNQQNHQNHQNHKDRADSAHEDDDDEDDDDNEDDAFERKSVDSAMDLSQGTPVKDGQSQAQTPEFAMNLKLQDDSNETPLISTVSSSRRKGRVLKLDTLLHTKLALPQLPDQNKESLPNELPTASSPIAPVAMPAKMDDHQPSSADVSMETASQPAVTTSPVTAPSANTSASSTASSSGNSSNSSSSSAVLSPPAGTFFECKYCDIYFKDAVLYTIHMGYHSCDDVFKCNMCGEKCDGPVGLFVHMARNAHS